MNLDNLKVSLAPEYYFFYKYLEEHFGHEMRISKASQTVFPYLNYRIEGLNPETMYSMNLHFELTSTRRFQYESGKWSPVGEAAKHGPPKQVRHERGILSGKDWMKGGFSFMLARITCDFESNKESEIPLHLNHKYRPVVSIREEPTPEKPNPPVIECRLKHTEFITVTEITNKHARCLKLINKIGYLERGAMREKTAAEPTIFATCTFVNASNVLIPEFIPPTLSTALEDSHQLSIEIRASSNNQVGTSTSNLSGSQGVTTSIFNHQEENDGTQEQNINKNSSNSLGSVHPLSVEKLYLPIVEMGIENPEPIQDPESIRKKYPPALLKQLTAMNVREALKFITWHIPTALLTPGKTFSREAIKQLEAQKVIQVDFIQNGREGTVTPTPAVEPPQKKRLVQMDRGERNTGEEEDVVFLGEYKATQPREVPNNSSMPQFQLPTAQTHFSPQILQPTLPMNYGLHQTPLPFPANLPHASTMANLPSTFIPNSMLQPSVTHPQFTFPMMPTQNIYSIPPPHYFGPFPHSFNTVYPPMVQPFMYPPPQNEPNSNSKKRPFQNDM